MACREDSRPHHTSRTKSEQGFPGLSSSSLFVSCRHGFSFPAAVAGRSSKRVFRGFAPRGERSAERRHFAVPASALAGFGGRALSGERVAFRRSTAAILGLGTVLPG